MQANNNDKFVCFCIGKSTEELWMLLITKTKALDLIKCKISDYARNPGIRDCKLLSSYLYGAKTVSREVELISLELQHRLIPATSSSLEKGEE